jgi:hypothetical protein
MDETSATGLSPLEEQDLFVRIKQWHSEASQHSGAWRDETRESYAFVAGDQYDEKDRARLKELMRPCLSFNRIGPVIDSVSGMEVNNRQEVRYIPRTLGDVKVNEQLTDGAAWVRDECDAEDEESDAFIDLLIAGIGWTETRIEYETDPDGMIRIERVDPFEMYWDPSARRRNLDDSRYLLRVREMDISDAKAMFPDVDESCLNATWTSATETESKPIDREAARNYESEASRETPRRGRVRIAECQWWELEPFWRAIDPLTGTITELSEADYKKLSKKVTLESVKQQRRVYKRAFLGTKVLEGGPAPCEGHFTYRCMTGKRDRNKGDWYGLVRAMKDPQRYANKLMSSALHIMSTSGKGIMAEIGAVDDVKAFEEDYAHPDKVIWLADGAIAQGRVTPKPGSQIPPGLPDLLMQSISAIRDVSGVNLEMLGMADRQQAGVLEAQRKQSAMTVLATLFDSLRRYRKEQGRVLLYFIKKYMNDGRLMRVTQDESEGYQPFRIDDETIKYDVIVDQSATSPNQKEATWVVLGQLMPTLMKLPIPPEMWVEIIKHSPLPESFGAKMKAIMDKQAQQPPAPDPEMVKAENQMKIEQDKNAAALDMKRQEMEFEQEKTVRTLNAQFAAEERKINEQARLKRIEAEADIELERDKAAALIEIKQFESAANLNMKREEMQMSQALAAKEQGEEREAADKSNGVQKNGFDSLATTVAQSTEAIIAALKTPRKMKTPDGRVYEMGQ